MRSVTFINIIRYLILVSSLIGLGCHFAQCTLLSVYQTKTNIPDWFTAGHWQYLSWYVLFCLSVLSGLAICTHATCCKRAHILRGDKCLGTVNITISMGIVLANTFLSGQEPWTNGIVEFKEPARGFIIYCSMLDEKHDATYPLLFQRCLLVDSTYVLAALVCLLWIVLVVCTYLLKPRRAVQEALLPNEGAWKASTNSKHNSVASNGYYPKLSMEQYNRPQKAHVKKYTTPISPQMEKIELPGSYDNRHSNQLAQQQPASSQYSYSRILSAIL